MCTIQIKPDDAAKLGLNDGEQARVLSAVGEITVPILDIAFREDESRIRKGSVPENFAAIGLIASNLSRNNKTFKGSVKSKRLNVAKNTDYLENVIFK